MYANLSHRNGKRNPAIRPRPADVIGRDSVEVGRRNGREEYESTSLQSGI